MTDIVLASRNEGKIQEFRKLLAGVPLRVLALKDFPQVPELEETGDTFASNARFKAETAAERTGLISVADDSGLEVDALDGAPGVRSARFAGGKGDDRRNNERLLELLQSVSLGKRTARFRCVLAVAVPGGETHLSEGTCEGYIGFTPRGVHGFGYDPIFVIPEYNRTLAELSSEEKNRISHRSQALAKARDMLLKLADVNGSVSI